LSIYTTKSEPILSDTNRLASLGGTLGRGGNSLPLKPLSFPPCPRFFAVAKFRASKAGTPYLLF